MKAPETIKRYLENYAETKNVESYVKVIEWLVEQHDEIDKFDIMDVFITDKPKGKIIGDGTEYRMQWPYGDTGDSFHGYYYHQMENSDKWLGYYYEM